jgi:hypothetical protein
LGAGLAADLAAGLAAGDAVDFAGAFFTGGCVGFGFDVFWDLVAMEVSTKNGKGRN